ncbi:MAG: hypothetical protein VW298_02535 [Candidatus Woesearchaeota archaeon]
MEMEKIIHNWNELSVEEKKEAEKQLKGNPGLNPSVVHPAAKFFEENRWVKIDKFIDQNMCNLLYHHIQLATQRLSYYEDNQIQTHNDIDGRFDDHQAPGDYSRYGDPIFDTLLNLSLEQMQTLTGKELVPTYSYNRLYTNGTELTPHKDRSSCEISTTLCLGYDVSNVDASVYPDWDWPMFIEELDGKKTPIHMKPGDMIIYRGCELKHWREPFWGKNHAQVFLHYNEKGGPFDIPFDCRPILGMTGDYRSKESMARQEPNLESKNKNISKKVIY